MKYWRFFFFLDEEKMNLILLNTRQRTSGIKTYYFGYVSRDVVHVLIPSGKG